MKHIAAEILLPLTIALSIAFYLSVNSSFSEFIFSKETTGALQKPNPRYIANFADNQDFEASFLKPGDSSEIIYLLGSSELTSNSAALPYNFISSNFNTKVRGIGSAGNQCLSIYSQLLANQNRLNSAPVVIIISPGWFESKPSKGTSSAIFLEYNSEKYLNRIIKQNIPAEFQTYLYQRISKLYSDFNSPNLEIRLMNFKGLASKSIIHKIIYSPIVFCDEVLLSIKENIYSSKNLDKEKFDLIKHAAIVPDSVIINWDSIFGASKLEVLNNSTNNKMGIANDYYTQYINGKRGHIQEVSENNNQELADFKMLVKLLKVKNVNTSFIISPLNPFYYGNINDILQSIKAIEKEISYNGFPYLNLLETDTAKYDKAMLNDVMHMSDYGWYKVNQFIINTYHLNK